MNVCYFILNLEVYSLFNDLRTQEEELPYFVQRVLVCICFNQTQKENMAQKPTATLTLNAVQAYM